MTKICQYEQDDLRQLLYCIRHIKNKFTPNDNFFIYSGKVRGLFHWFSSCWDSQEKPIKHLLLRRK